jgi:hypothetical protein
MCHKLGIRIIAAGSHQAKGRVERSNGVPVDRLIKMRLLGIRDDGAANDYAREKYLPQHNKRTGLWQHYTQDFGNTTLGTLLSVEDRGHFYPSLTRKPVRLDRRGGGSYLNATRGNDARIPNTDLLARTRPVLRRLLRHHHMLCGGVLTVVAFPPARIGSAMGCKYK